MGSWVFIFPDLEIFFGAFTVFCRKTKFLIKPVFFEPFDTVLFDWPHLLFVIGINRNASNSRTPAKLTFRAYPNNRFVMRPSENLSVYGGVPPLGVLRKESLGLRRGQGGRPKMPGCRQASLARRFFSRLRTFFHRQRRHRASLGDRAGY